MIIYKRQTVPFSSEFDTDPKSVFHLGQIDHVTTARLLDTGAEYSQGDEKEDKRRTILRLNEQNYLFAKCGLRGWENVKDESGADVIFEIEETTVVGVRMNVVKDNALAKIPYEIIQEVGRRIKLLNTFGETERKNLPAPSSST